MYTKEEDHRHPVELASKKQQKYEQDNNFRAAVLHVVADAFVSVLTIVAIALAGNSKCIYICCCITTTHNC